jgi:hypothetical protein
MDFINGEALRILPGAIFTNGKTIPSDMMDKVFFRGLDKHGNVMVGAKTSGAIAGSVIPAAVIPYVEILPRKYTFKRYPVRVVSDMLNVRTAPSAKADIVMKAKKNDFFMICDEENGWGQVLSGDWVSLEHVEKF